MARRSTRYPYVPPVDDRLMADVYPDVESVTGTITQYSDGDAISAVVDPTAPIGEISVSLSRESRAFTWVPTCRQRECVDGSFHVPPSENGPTPYELVAVAIRNRSESVSERVSCFGWQDRERVGKNRCMFALELDLTIRYRAT